MVTVSELREREVLTPGECARVWGRGPGYYRHLYALGRVDGYMDHETRACKKSKKPRLFLYSESVRAYYRRLAAERPEVAPPRRSPTMAEILAADPRIQAMRRERAAQSELGPL